MQTMLLTAKAHVKHKVDIDLERDSAARIGGAAQPCVES
jgi:hypothetical protein